MNYSNILNRQAQQPDVKLLNRVVEYLFLLEDLNPQLFDKVLQDQEVRVFDEILTWENQKLKDLEKELLKILKEI